MPEKVKKIRIIFIIYWFLLAYIIAALIWWFIALNQQSEKMAAFKTALLKTDDPAFNWKQHNISDEKERKTAQYIGEGSIFLLLIAAGAIFVYRSVKKQFRINRQQQHFMVAVTHELKTPIAVTKLNLETLQKRKLDEQQQQRLLENTIQEANRMNALCNNMLLSSQFESGGYLVTMEKTNMGELVENCVDDFRSRYPKKNIINNIQDGLMVSGDQMLLQIAINNLVDNAIKYTPKESNITVLAYRENKSIVLKVSDNGPGIPDTEKQKVFDKFHRLGNEATRQSKGTGLGLYLTQKIITAHHGHIFIEDNPNKGTVFVIHLKPFNL